MSFIVFTKIKEKNYNLFFSFINDVDTNIVCYLILRYDIDN